MDSYDGLSSSLLAKLPKHDLKSRGDFICEVLDLEIIANTLL